mmetsp:Transcript_6361/g.6615  ORF Transcript_6361/g.6615 Transcript_6361/m.6615 type:complete len:654 (-) Transcript_6361:51-2012(-)
MINTNPSNSQSNINNMNSLNNLGISSPLKTETNKLPIINNSNSGSLVNRGKAVLGIQPMTQPNTYQDDYRRDELTKRKFDEINSNLDIFRTELTNTMRKINKNQSKLKVDTVIEEMSDFKNTFIDSLQRAERKKEEENEYLLKEIKNLKNEIKRNYEEGKSNYKVIRSFQDDIFEFEREITNRITRMEQNQAEQFDKIYGLLNNLTLLKQQGRGRKGEHGDLKGLLDNEVYNNDNKNDRGLDKNYADRLENIQGKNAVIEEDVNKNNRALFDKGMTTDLKDHYRVKELEERQKEMPIIKHKLNKANVATFKLRPKHKLKGIMGVAHGIAKFRLNRIQATNSVKLDALHFFVNNLKKSNSAIEEWMRQATKTAVNSILQFESLEIDMSEFIAVGGNPSPEVKDCFIRLQTRIKGVIESIGNNIFSNPLDITTMTWLRIPITNNYIVPYGWYFNFILSRIYVSHGEVLGIEVSHQLMILTSYLIVSTLVGKILIEEMRNSKNSNVKKNLKMMASVFYHSLLKFFKERVKIVTNIPNFAEFIKSQGRDKPEVDIKFSKDSSLEYRKALKRYYTKVEKKMFDTNAESQSLLDKTEGQFHSAGKDNNPNEMYEISTYLYSDRQMDSFFKLCDMNNFKVANYVLNLASTFVKKIYSTEA